MTHAIDSASPFDRLRRSDSRGEYWSAREMVTPLGYERWARFEPAIERTIAACRNAGQDPSEHCAGVSTMLPIGNGAHRPAEDFRLTRFGAYLLAMNSDPRKPEVAEAQSYFAIKTREAEIAQAAVPAPVDILTAPLEVVAKLINEAVAAQRAQADLERRVDAIQSVVDAREGKHDWFAALGYARLHGHPTSARYLSRVGLHAARLARSAGITPDRVCHALYGEVNELPSEIWARAFAEIPD